MSFGISIHFVLALLAGYILGSIPTAIWACRYLFHLDITKVGSGNPGMTNVWRTLGWKPALPVALFDTAKGSLAAYVGFQFTQSMTGALVAGMSAILGHSFSFLAGFKGGKGVLTALGVFVFLSPLASLLGLSLWGIVMALSRIVSLSSMVAAFALPFLTYGENRLQDQNGFSPTFAVSILVSAFVLIRHRTNFKRLLAGTEPKFKGKSA